MKIIYLSMLAALLAGCYQYNSSDGVSVKTQQESQGQGDTVVFNAIQENDLQVIKSYIEAKNNLEIRNTNNETLLMAAVYQKNNQVAEQLILAGADVNAQDNMKNSPFLYAGAEGNIEVVKLSLKYGANFKIYNRYGGSALIPAAEKGHVDVVKILANEPGYPINHVNNLGWTAINEAIILGKGGRAHTEIVKVLIDAGADVNIPDSKGITPLQHAKSRGFTQIIKLLEASGAR